MHHKSYFVPVLHLSCTQLKCVTVASFFCIVFTVVIVFMLPTWQGQAP